MNDASDPADEPQVFYSSKPRLFHMAVNIAIAPVLLYLLGVGVAWLFGAGRKKKVETGELTQP